MRCHRVSVVFAFAVIAWVAACSGNSGTPIIVTETLGPAGGTISVSDGVLEGLVLQIPAGALDKDYDVSIANGQISKVPGALPVGPPALVQPPKLELLALGSLDLPFDRDSIPPNTPDSELRAGYRDGAGRVSFVELSAIDRSTGIATIDVEGFGTWWIVVPDAFEIADYLPLNDGDTYLFESNVAVSIAHTSNEPNLVGQSIVKVTVSQPQGIDGYYWDNSSGGLELLGRFFAPGSQEVLDSPATLLAPRELIGSSRTSTYTFLGFVPYGSTFVDYSGIAITDTSPEQRTELSVPAGAFDDCIVISSSTVFRLSPPLDGSESLVLWLARDVGPVQLQFDNATPLRLRSANVGGQTVGPN